VAVSVVYLGEHYVADVIAGAMFAGAGYVVAEAIYGRLRQPGEANARLAPVELVD
jgi:membrane-associated phospholipid phosphatase